MAKIDLKLSLLKKEFYSLDQIPEDQFPSGWLEYDLEKHPDMRFFYKQSEVSVCSTQEIFRQLTNFDAPPMASAGFSFCIFLQVGGRVALIPKGPSGWRLIRDHLLDRKFPIDVALKKIHNGSLTNLDVSKVHNSKIKSFHQAVGGGCEKLVNFDPLLDSIDGVKGTATLTDIEVSFGANKSRLAFRGKPDLIKIREIVHNLVACYNDDTLVPLFYLPFCEINDGLTELDEWMVKQMWNPEAEIAFNLPYNLKTDESTQFIYRIDNDFYEYVTLNFKDYFELKMSEELTVIDLHEDFVEVRSESTCFKFSVYELIAFSDYRKGELLMLVGGGWKKYSLNVVSFLKKEIDEIPAYPRVFPDAIACDTEGSYSERICDQDKTLALMDKKIVSIGGGASKVEVCDIIDHDSLIFFKPLTNKNGHASSAHFTYSLHQILASVDLLLMGSTLRELGGVHQRILNTGTDMMDEAFFQSKSVVLGIISSKTGKLSEILPMVSILALRNTFGLLRSKGISLSVSIIHRPLAKKEYEEKDMAAG